ncbi:MAG: transposase, partial [Polyangiaceae bacterium]|nr:transposase [Polyangiaceae bacterium]
WHAARWGAAPCGRGAPTEDDLAHIVRRIRDRSLRWLKKHGILDLRPAEERSNEAPDAGALDACADIALRGGLLVRLDDDGPARSEDADDRRFAPRRRSPFTAELDGFNLQAAVRIEAADDEARERLARYCARPAFALDRLSVLPDGRIAYEIKVPSKRATHRVMSPIELLARLAALVPPPRYPLVRYHGVLAPHSKWHSEVVPRPSALPARPAPAARAAPAAATPLPSACTPKPAGAAAVGGGSGGSWDGGVPRPNVRGKGSDPRGDEAGSKPRQPAPEIAPRADVQRRSESSPAPAPVPEPAPRPPQLRPPEAGSPITPSDVEVTLQGISVRGIDRRRRVAHHPRQHAAPLLAVRGQRPALRRVEQLDQPFLHAVDGVLRRHPLPAGQRRERGAPGARDPRDRVQDVSGAVIGLHGSCEVRSRADRTLQEIVPGASFEDFHRRGVMDRPPETSAGWRQKPMTTNPVRAIQETEFEAEVVRAQVPVLVDFTTTWCSPCRLLAPILHKIAEEGAGRLKVVAVDGDEQAALAARFRIKAFPTVIAFAGGKEVARHVGLTTKEKLLQLVQAHTEPRSLQA